MQRWFITAGIVAAFAVVVAISYWMRTPQHSPSPASSLRGGVASGGEETFPLALGPHRGFATSNSCEECHPSQHASWHASYHRTMTQLASPETVVGDFDGVALADYRQTALLERRGDEFWVQMTDQNALLSVSMPGASLAELPRTEQRVVMTTGSHHFQAYWTKARGDTELWLFPWRFHIPTQRWIHRRDVFVQPNIDIPAMHHKVWNGECIDCHSTGGRPGLDQVRRHYVTEVAELGISCEACHGPAEEHVALAHASESDGKPVDDWKIVNPSKLDSRASLQVCGQCHSDMFPLRADHLVGGKGYTPGQELNRFLGLTTPGQPLDPAYWADGVCRAGGREYNALLRSGCHLYGELSCLSCHSMHDSDPDDQLAVGMRSDQACFQCHEDYREKVEEHTHHAPESSGSRCYNCHMPHTSFALLKAIRSHRIGSPQVESFRPDGQPNACNMCHLDKTLSWTAEQLTAWYGQSPVELTEDENTIAASLLWMLKGDAAQRIVAAWHMGWDPAKQAGGGEWITPHLAQLLNDDYPAVRWVAAEALRKMPDLGEFKYQWNEDPATRRQAAETVISQWDTPSGRIGAAILVTPEGKPDTETVNRLLTTQDKRPVGILE